MVFIWCWIDTNCSSLLTLNTTLSSKTKQLHLVATYENTLLSEVKYKLYAAADGIVGGSL